MRFKDFWASLSEVASSARYLVPMRFNFHEYVRPQLSGELEQIIMAEGLDAPESVRAFLGYIRVLRVAKLAAN